MNVLRLVNGQGKIGEGPTNCRLSKLIRDNIKPVNNDPHRNQGLLPGNQKKNLCDITLVITIITIIILIIIIIKRLTNGMPTFLGLSFS